MLYGLKQNARGLSLAFNHSVCSLDSVMCLQGLQIPPRHGLQRPEGLSLRHPE